jgi:hypothetical protein
VKLAIIPPLCWPYRFNESDDNYKLILPMHWNNQGHYEATMLNHRRGGFTILDNGVAEGMGVPFKEIQDLARRYCVNEVVLPDVIGDAEATRAAVEAIMAQMDHTSWGYMGVVQGTSFAELRAMADFYGGLQGGWGVQCIGIPRHLLSTIGEEDIRYQLASYIRSRDSRIGIHLLGTNPECMSELRHLGELFRSIGVRGVDTSAPFVYAQAHVASWIGGGNTIKRPEDYFDLSRGDFDRAVLAQNLDTLVRWVHG